MFNAEILEMYNTIYEKRKASGEDLSEYKTCPITELIERYNFISDYDRAIKYQKSDIEHIKNNLLQKLRKEVCKDIALKIRWFENEDKEDKLDFVIDVKADYSRKYCEISASRIVEVEQCNLYIQLYDIYHDEIANFIGLIARSFTDFVHNYDAILAAEGTGDE